MPKKLFIGGLPFVYSDAELQALFAGSGTVVSAAMVFDPDRNRSRGFGFVEMSTPEEGSAAIAKLSGTQMGEKKIYVTEAREKALPKAAPAPSPFKQKQFRKVGRNPLGRSQSPYASNPYDAPAAPAPDSFDKPRIPGAFGRFQKKGFSKPENPRGGFGRGGFGSRDRRPGSDAPRGGFGFRDRRPSSEAPRSGAPRSEHTPGSFGRPPSKGFSKPGNKWEPRSDGKNSFSAPRKSRGDFGPSDRKPSNPGSKPPKREFWRKFEKKKPSDR